MTNEKEEKKIFTEDFHQLSTELSPIIAEYLKENNIHFKPSLFFFASLIKDMLSTLDDPKEIAGMFHTLERFMMDD